METDNINVKNFYFNDGISNFNQTLLMIINNRSNIVNDFKVGTNIIYCTDIGHVIALKADGNVVTLTGEGVPADLSNVNKIYSTERAFAALKDDGTVVAWGNSDYGGTNVPADLSNVNKIYSTQKAFVALKDDGTVVAWGHPGLGGTVPADLSNVNKIYFTQKAFVALKDDGTVVAWGGPFNTDVILNTSGYDTSHLHPSQVWSNILV